MRRYIDRYNQSWRLHGPSTVVGKIVLGVRLLLLATYFAVVVVLMNHILPPPTTATVLMNDLIRTLFTVAYFVLDWIVFVRMRGY